MSLIEQPGAYQINWDPGKDVTYEILIANLGGYEKAKEWYKDQDLRGNHTVRIRAALLQYRRQHNIFEVGDRVVILTMHLDNKFVHVVSKVLEDLVEVCGSYVYSSELRHATPEEIAAGKKLEGNS